MESLKVDFSKTYPKRLCGHYMGNKDARVCIDFVGDLQCQLTKKNWLNLLSVLPEFIQSNKLWVGFHLTGCPMNLQSYDLARLAESYIRLKVKSTGQHSHVNEWERAAAIDAEFFQCIKGILEWSHEFQNENVLKYPRQTVLENMVDRLMKQSAEKINRDEILKMMDSKGIIKEVLAQHRFSVEHGSWMTPTILVNRFHTSELIGKELSVDMWRKILLDITSPSE